MVALTSEERRSELAYGFGGTRSALVKEELIAALSDPSFDVRHEAIQSLGRLPRSKAVVLALESVLDYEGLIELQYAALAALGRIKATASGDLIARFLDSANPLLRARAMRSIGDIRDATYLPRIRTLLAEDPDLDGRLAAVSALGKFRDRESIDGLLEIYRQLVTDGVGISGEPRSKVVLLALAKIFDWEESFSREWRREERILGYRLPDLVARLGSALRRRSSIESNQHSKLLMQRRRGAEHRQHRRGAGGTAGAAALRSRQRPRGSAACVETARRDARDRAAAPRSVDPAGPRAAAGARRLAGDARPADVERLSSAGVVDDQRFAIRQRRGERQPETPQLHAGEHLAGVGAARIGLRMGIDRRPPLPR